MAWLGSLGFAGCPFLACLASLARLALLGFSETPPRDAPCILELSETSPRDAPMARKIRPSDFQTF